MDPGDQITTLEELSTWKTESLRHFLTMRGLSKDGTKDEMVALCYSAGKLGLPVKPSQSEVLQDNKNCYLSILTSCNIQDPLHLSDGWLEEKTGISRWPPTFLSDITSFLLSHGDESSVSQVLKDYKVGKAYEYFACGWLQEVFFHPLDSKSPVCILRAKCTPSQRLKNEDHDVWVCINKEDGSVKAAYCSCTAGLGQTCNHVASLLFRAEAANRYGITSCTSSKCAWVIPKELKGIQPSLLCSMNIKKSSRSKSVKSRPLVSKEKNTYDPLMKPDDGDETRNSISIAVRGLLPNACLFTGLPSSSIIVGDTRGQEVQPQEEEAAVSTEASHPKISSYNMCHIASEFKTQTTCYDFLNFLPKICRHEIITIEKCTIGQHENENWHLMHKGRITASRFYQVFTKVQTILKNSKNNINTDCSSLIKTIMGYTKVNPNIKSLKHGRETEPVAVRSYLSNYRRNHSNVISCQCGLFIDKDFIFLAASPDLLISCSCCGDGLLEVKCPLIPECKLCNGFCTCNLPDYLIYQNGVYQLKLNHAYYAQVQGQLAITGRQWCDLFVFTCNGHLETRVIFNKESYTSMLLPNLKLFFTDYIVPELLNQKHKPTEQNTEPMDVDHDKTEALCRYFCPTCRNVIKESENIVSYNDRSVACDKCNLWYHLKCVNEKMSQVKKKTQWFCPKCTEV